MARITYSPGVTKLAGSIGGVTYQRNAFGNTIKQKSNLAKTPTALQAGYQQRLSYLVSLWPTLTQVKKDTWNVFAAAHPHTTTWGSIKKLSGYQWFLSCNLKRMLYHTTAITDPPVWTIEEPPPVFTINYTALYIAVTFSPFYSPANSIIAYCSLPLKQSSLKLRRSFYLIKTIYKSLPFSNLSLTNEISTLIGSTWTHFANTADSSLIIRLQQGEFDKGLFSPYTSAIVKINS